MQRIRQLSLQTLETIDEVDRLAPIDVPIVASAPRCELQSTSTHPEPSSSYARSTLVKPSTSVPPPTPRWPPVASTPFPSPSSSSVPPRGRPSTSTPVRDLASSFTPSPQVEPPTSMPDMFMEDYRTPPHAVMPLSLSTSFTPGAPSHFPSFGPSIDAIPADIAHHTPPHQLMMSQDIGVAEHQVRRGGRGRGRARIGDRGRGRAMDHGVHPHPGVEQHVIHDHPKLDHQDVDGLPRRVRHRPLYST
ncbi:hypothetical protein L1049_009128 [Liquidambar formosana]|uniref:Uncharacterized protein n=1 Tax=Liquidambar formosana TaxID=63359 RepID=A0AAP0X8R0_LIQFO